MQQDKRLSKLSFLGVVISFGIIYGDIGTSPLYVFKAILGSTSVVDREYVLGALSCIIWTLTLQTTIKYVIITLRADNKGEGGIFALFALMRRQKKWLFVLAIIGGSTLLADGIITPAITVVSSIEGLNILSPELPVVKISLIIIALIFFVQQFGTATIGKSFGVIMAIWFSTLAILGSVQLVGNFEVLNAFNPVYAIKMVFNHSHGLLLLGAVFLCTTGAEALYADLGHCGIKNIRTSWAFVKTCLLLNYLGQGAWVLQNLDSINHNTNPFFAMMPSWFLIFGIILSTMAAIIASQALISGSFTLISEAISLNFWPKIKIKYPSFAKGQMYIPAINVFLFFSCSTVIILFQTSSNMEAAYGLSITITMLMTTLLMFYYLKLKNVNIVFQIFFLTVYLFIELIFLFANLEKIANGGWFTITIAMLLSSIMLIMYLGRKIRNKFITFRSLENYIPVLESLSMDNSVPKYSGHLVYMTRADRILNIEDKTIFSIISRKPKRADYYWFLHVEILDQPFEKKYKATELGKNIYRIDFFLGFKVNLQIYEYFKQVISDLKEQYDIDMMSKYQSLRSHKIKADFRFVQVERPLSRSLDLGYYEKVMLNLYFFIRKFEIGDVKAYGLNPSLMTIEKIPLTVPVKSLIPRIEQM